MTTVPRILTLLPDALWQLYADTNGPSAIPCGDKWEDEDEKAPTWCYEPSVHSHRDGERGCEHHGYCMLTCAACRLRELVTWGETVDAQTFEVACGLWDDRMPIPELTELAEAACAAVW